MYHGEPPAPRFQAPTGMPSLGRALPPLVALAKSRPPQSSLIAPRGELQPCRRVQIRCLPVKVAALNATSHLLRRNQTGVRAWTHEVVLVRVLDNSQLLLPRPRNIRVRLAPPQRTGSDSKRETSLSVGSPLTSSATLLGCGNSQTEKVWQHPSES